MSPFILWDYPYIVELSRCPLRRITVRVHHLKACLPSHWRRYSRPHRRGSANQIWSYSSLAHADTVDPRSVTEDPNCIVGIIEIGNSHNDDPIVKIPGFIGRNLAEGSSMVNFLACSRPTKSEIDAIEELGNPGWNWESVGHTPKRANVSRLLTSPIKSQ
ncbi:unnamed protein product [Somion occarium]|uniref:Uncharacterized protein n=1 Tax=Somion occarium TaxID=3059160 RepID=A0ABP1DJD4_9APHY